MAHTHTHSLTLTHSHTHTHSHSLTLTQSHSLSHTLTQTHSQTASYYSDQLNSWLTFVEISKVKAFVELSIAPDIRTGSQNLLAVSA